MLGVDIKGLTNDKAREKVELAELQNEAKKVGLDIKGLSKDKAWEKIKNLINYKVYKEKLKN